MGKKLQPKLRFRGFTDAWEQRRFVECFDFLKTNTFPRDYLQLSGNGTVDIHYGDILINYNSCLSIANNALPCIKREDYLDCHNYSLLKDGDVVFADTAEDRTVGKCVELLKVGERRALAGLHTIAVRNRIECAVGYLGFYFNSPFYRKQLLPKMQGSKVVAISKDVLKQSFISVPSTKEQLLISKLLNKIDSLVDAEKRKLLQKKKTTLLRQIFGQKLRFKGYDNPWEPRRLGEIATVVGGGTPDTNNPSYWNGDINWFTPAEIGSNVYASKSERRITEEGLEHSSAKLLPAGRTILFTSRASIGLTAILTVDACTNQGFQSLVVSDRTDVFFLFGLCNQIKAQAIRNAAGSTFIEVSGKQLARIPLQVPSLDEQRRIGKIVRTMDSLIDAATRKIDILKLKKKALLQQMFV